MIIHLGWDVVVTLERVIAILSAVSLQPETRALVDAARRERRFTPCAEGVEKAFVLTQEQDGALMIIASSISPATLRRRLERPAWE